jgi:hypothetical protein
VRALHPLVVLIGALLGAPGCGASRPAPPPGPALQASRPAAAVPADLDVVVRIDLDRIRRVLGSEVAAALRAAASASAGDRLLATALSQADTAWIGFRPGLAAEHIDNVVVLRGRFAGFDPPRAEWGLPTDLGAVWRRYDRSSPPDRSAPARLYAWGEELLVFASTAEIDSVERAVEGGQNESALEPPERGVLSVAARSAMLAESVAGRSPAAARLLRKSRRLVASAELGDTELRAEVELSFELEENARSAADAAGLLVTALRAAPGALGQFAGGISVEAVASTLVVRVRAPLQTVRALAM